MNNQLRYLAVFLLFFSGNLISHNVHLIGTWYGGFFANFNCVLNHLSWCEENNKIPMVYWDNRSLYHTPAGFNGSHNVWEYYFEPVSHFTKIPTTPINLTFTPGAMHFYCENQTPLIRVKANRIINKYIKIKPSIQNKIDAFYQTHMLNKHTIGIHLRGTDKYNEEKLVSPEKIVFEALKHADHNTQFLLASDEEPLLNRMISLLNGYNIIFYNCYRSNNSIPLHYSHNFYSIAQLGEDVLVEVTLLSKCDKLIHTLSNVATGALYMNPYMENVLVRDDSYTK